MKTVNLLIYMKKRLTRPPLATPVTTHHITVVCSIRPFWHSMCIFELVCKWISATSLSIYNLWDYRYSPYATRHEKIWLIYSWNLRFLDYELRFHNFVQRVAMVGTSVYYIEVPTILFWYNSEITNWYIIVYLYPPLFVNTKNS